MAIHSMPFISLESLLTIGRLLVHEYMMSFHLPKSSLISLNNVYCTDFLLLLLNLFLSISFFTLMLLEVNCWDVPSGPVVGTWSFPGEFRLPLVLAQASPIFHSSCEGKLGIALE